MKDLDKKRKLEVLLMEAIEKKYSFFVWQTIAGHVEKCEAKIKFLRKELMEIEYEIWDQGADWKKIISGQKSVNLFCPENSISFTAEMKVFGEANRLKVSYPHSFEFVERRKHARVRPETPSFIHFEAGAFIARKPIYDISLGGIAVVLSKTDRLSVEKGKVFEKAILEIGGKKIKLHMECVDSTKLDRFRHDNFPYGGHKIAFRFTAIEAIDRMFLRSYLATLAISQLGRRDVEEDLQSGIRKAY